MQKVVYPYEYMGNWEKLNETLLPETEEFYSYLNMEDITDADYTHAKRVCEDLEKTFRRISWFVCSKQYFIVSRRILKILNYVLRYMSLIL